MEKEYPPSALLEKLDRSLDRDQDRALFDLPPRSPRRRSSPLRGLGVGVAGQGVQVVTRQDEELTKRVLSELGETVR